MIRDALLAVSADLRDELLRGSGSQADPSQLVDRLCWLA